MREGVIKMDSDILKNLYAQALGQEAAKYISALRPGDLAPLINREALSLLGEIKAVLDDGTLDDPQCFRRIEVLVDAFHAHGLPTNRHDW